MWSAEEILDGQHQRVDIPACARTAYEGLLQKTRRGSMLNRPSWPPNDPIGQGTELNWDIFLVQLYINVHNFEMVSSNTSVSGLYLSGLVKYLCTCLALSNASVPVWPCQTPLYLSGLVLATCEMSFLDLSFIEELVRQLNMCLLPSDWSFDTFWCCVWFSGFF